MDNLFAEYRFVLAKPGLLRLEHLVLSCARKRDEADSNRELLSLQQKISRDLLDRG